MHGDVNNAVLVGLLRLGGGGVLVTFMIGTEIIVSSKLHNVNLYFQIFRGIRYKLQSAHPNWQLN